MMNLAKQALEDYAKDNYNHNAGYDVIRYYKKGLYNVKIENLLEAMKMAFDWHPRNLMYIVLRLAKKEMLEISEKSDGKGLKSVLEDTIL